MDTHTEETGRKSQPRPSFHPARRTSRNLLAKLREDIATLKVMGLDQAAIARALRIRPEDVRALLPAANDTWAAATLTHRSIMVLIEGRHAERGGKKRITRARRLAEIATAYSADELMSEPGVGQVTFNDIRWRLKDRGLTFRKQSRYE